MSTAPDSSAALAAASSLKMVSTTSFEHGLVLAPVVRIGLQARCAGRPRARRACRRRCRRAWSRPCRCRPDRSTSTNCSRSVICRSGAGPLKLRRDGRVVHHRPVLHEGHGGVDVLALLRIGRLLRGSPRPPAALNGVPLWNFTSLRSVSGDRGVVRRDRPVGGEARHRLAVRACTRSGCRRGS